MSLQRDELAARAMAARAALLSLCDALSALVPVAPASGAPLAAPSRPEWVRITGPEDAEDVTIGKAYRVLRWTDVRGGRPSITNDAGVEWVCAGPNEDGHDTLPKWEPCAAPSPAATPAAWVPSVGDVVRFKGCDSFAEIVVVRVDGPKFYGKIITQDGLWQDEGERDSAEYRFVRRATSSERAAAGLPVDETPAFDEAREREAARVACKWVIPADAKMFTEGWLARARVAAKGGAK